MTDEELKYLRALQPEFKKILYGDESRLRYIKELKTVLFVPPAIDPENPKRGLWGMVDWSLFKIAKVFDNGNIAIRNVELDECKFYVADTPYLALLKALAHQWGIGVKE